MFRFILTWLDRLFLLEVAASALLAFLIGVFVFVSASMRYVFGAPLDFSDELVALMFVSSAFLALPYAARRGINIRLDILVRRLSAPVQGKLQVITGIVTIVIFTAFAVAAVEDIAMAIEFEEVTDVAEVPVYPFKALVLFSGFSVILALICNLFVAPLPSANGELDTMEAFE
ncbi:TRAP transporter small permease [Thalassovita sp.]|uniref:TRAP transporter small permease n=1 Tax=Thalassovita sp. TaxID=1979401 RepID=UPI0029DE6645|nr:TRAP transporter small permease [Thalassovita sp.]